MHPGQQAIWGPDGHPRPLQAPIEVPSAEEVAAAHAEMAAPLEQLRGYLRQAIAVGEPQTFALHDGQVGAPRFASVPDCDQQHPGCTVRDKGDVIGKGASRSRFVIWAFPGWRIFGHYVWGRGYSDRDESLEYRYETFFVDTVGNVYNHRLANVGTIEDLSAAAIPPRRYRERVVESALVTLTLELERWKSGAATSPPKPASTEYVDELLATFLAEMARRNNPGLTKIRGTGLFPRYAWAFYATGTGHLFTDGTISYFTMKGYPKESRPVGNSDIEHLEGLCRSHSVAVPPKPRQPQH